jgi:hypothetical protein
MATAPKVDSLQAKDLAASYNYAYALLMSDASLRAVFTQALTDKTGEWTPEKFAAKVRTTSWFKNHSESWRTTEALRLTDPSQYAADIAAKKAEVLANAATMGATLTDVEANALATTFYRSGYSPAQANEALSAYVKPPEVPGGLTGNAGQIEDMLRTTAEKNGQSYSDNFYYQAAQAVVGGKSDVQAFTDQIRRDAASTYPVFADKIIAGMDVADLASGYTTKMAQTLEMDPAAVKLTDPYIKQALGGIDQSGNPTAMGMWDFEKTLRNDPRWAQTKQAKDASDNAAYNVLKSFGFAS